MKRSPPSRNKFLFPKMAYAITALLFLISLQFYMKEDPQIAVSYHQLMQEGAHLRSQRALEHQPLHQRRIGVQKDLWTLRNGQRTHTSLQSEVSDLICIEKQRKIQASESLSLCQWVEEVEDPLSSTQKTHQATAEKATLFYPDQTASLEEFQGTFCMGVEDQLAVFQAQRVDWSQEKIGCFMHLSGYTTPSNDRTAQTIFFRAPQAECIPSLHRWNFPQSLTLFQPGSFEADASDATLLCSAQWRARLFTMQQVVHFVSYSEQKEPFYALCDFLSYDFASEKLLLEGKQQRVVFWQKGASLSAPQVLMQGAPFKKQPSIQALGDVRLSLDPQQISPIEPLAPRATYGTP